MGKLGQFVKKIRSKNAGPFWITVDIFCGNPHTFNQVCSALKTERIAQLLTLQAAAVKRFDIEDLAVIKISFPRHHVQGSRFDRDIHGAQIANLFAELQLDMTDLD